MKPTNNLLPLLCILFLSACSAKPARTVTQYKTKSLISVPAILLQDTPLPQEVKEGDDIGVLEEAHVEAILLIKKNNVQRAEIRRLLEEANKAENE